jgi:hypothetical protein
MFISNGHFLKQRYYLAEQIREDKRQKYYEKLKQKHGKGKALSVLAAKLGRAVYHMLKKKKLFDEEKIPGTPLRLIGYPVCSQIYWL